jgi:hypothetical protein
MTYLETIIVLTALYVIAESHLAICRMAEGLNDFCHKLKYVSAMGTMVGFIYAAIFYKLPLGVWVLLVAASITIALFVWPRMVYRIKFWIDNLIEGFGL